MSHSPAVEWVSLDAGVVAAGLLLPTELRAQALSRLSATDVQCLVVPAEESSSRPCVWKRVPVEIAALASSPASEAAILCREESQATSRSSWEVVLNAIDAGGLRVDAELQIPRPQISVAPPALSPEAEGSIPGWWTQHIHALPQRLARKTSSDADVIALQAGLLQMADQLHASHEASQSIEGAGRNLAGDYWHAIQHRRERDYGNAKYWFRRVGRHSVLEVLGERAAAIAGEFSVGSHQVVTSLVSGRRLDPMRFVDLAQSIDRGESENLRPFAEALQWTEMVLLLEQTWHDASSR